jgi:hypothetical protein
MSATPLISRTVGPVARSAALGGLLLLFAPPSFAASAPQAGESDYLAQVARADVGHLWLDGEVQAEAEGEVWTLSKDLPLGFIGAGYQRFEIHLASAVKDPTNPTRYRVTGKTRVRENVVPFSGTIDIEGAKLAPDVDLPDEQLGFLVGRYRFAEDRRAAGSGRFEGTFRTDWVLGPKGKIRYFFLANTDGFSNNAFQGTWTSYRTGAVKKCNWGDYRIPGSDELDYGAAYFHPADRYVKNGWENYVASLGPEGPEATKAQERESWPWWR